MPRHRARRHVGSPDRIAAGDELADPLRPAPFPTGRFGAGAFLAVVARQRGGLVRLVRAFPGSWPPPAVCSLSPLSDAAGSGQGQELVLPERAAMFQVLLACLLLGVLIAPDWSATSRFFRSRAMVFLGT
jgi:hypothetical protein